MLAREIGRHARVIEATIPAAADGTYDRHQYNYLVRTLESVRKEPKFVKIKDLLNAFVAQMKAVVSFEAR